MDGRRYGKLNYWRQTRRTDKTVGENGNLQMHVLASGCKIKNEEKTMGYV